LTRLGCSCEQLSAHWRDANTSLDCDEACFNIIHKTHAELRRVHDYATGKDQPAISESGCCRNETEAVVMASHFKLAIDNAAAK